MLPILEQRLVGFMAECVLSNKFSKRQTFAYEFCLFQVGRQVLPVGAFLAFEEEKRSLLRPA